MHLEIEMIYTKYEIRRAQQGYGNGFNISNVIVFPKTDSKKM